MFTKRTTKPEKGNKYYTTISNGGYSYAIKGMPTDKDCDVLSNCVGYANGRFAEIIGKNKIEYQLVSNAENFIERAEKLGLKVSDKPAPGAIMVWRKGDTLSGSDGAGHVAVVEEVVSDNEVLTSESVYGGSAFFTKCRKNTDGRWGENKNFTFRGFILNPAVVDNLIVAPVERDESKNQIYVSIPDLRVRTSPGINSKIIGFAKQGYYNFYDVEYNGAYAWYKISEDQWIAYSSDWAIVYNSFNVGDKVRILPDSPVYDTNKRFADFVYKSVLYVREINKNRIVISVNKSGAITGAIDAKYLEKV